MVLCDSHFCYLTVWTEPYLPHVLPPDQLDQTQDRRDISDLVIKCKENTGSTQNKIISQNEGDN